MQLSNLAKRAWLLLFIAIAAFYFWGLGSLPLVGPDEPRYAEVAREMLARRDFVTPTLGNFPWFEKPPLLYWMMMASYRVLGVNEYAARLGPAICGLVTGVFIYWIGKSIGESREQGIAIGRWSALAWLSSLGAIGFSRGATFDIVLTMTISGALACFFIWQVRTGKGNDAARFGGFLLAGFYLFTALSLLAKGLIGSVIIFGVLTLYFVVRREWPIRRFAISLIWGLPVSLAIASIWYGPMMLKHGWAFIDQFIIQHHFARFTSNRYHHPGPFYFYLPVLIALVLPWTIVLGASLLSARRWHWRDHSSLDRARVFWLAWLLFPLVFFSFSGSKLDGYILPAVPAAALLIGERVSCFCREQRGEKVLRLTGVLLIAIAALAVWYTHQNGHVSFSLSALPALPFFLAGLISIARPQLRRYLFVVIAISALLTAGVGLRYIAPRIASTLSVSDLLIAASAHGYSATRVVQLHTIQRSAEFYAPNRLAYGSDGEPIKFEGAAQVIDSARRSGGTVLCFVPIEFESQLTTLERATTEILGDNGSVALVVVTVK